MNSLELLDIDIPLEHSRMVLEKIIVSMTNVVSLGRSLKVPSRYLGMNCSRYVGQFDENHSRGQTPWPACLIDKASDQMSTHSTDATLEFNAICRCTT